MSVVGEEEEEDEEEGSLFGTPTTNAWYHLLMRRCSNCLARCNAAGRVLATTSSAAVGSSVAVSTAVATVVSANGVATATVGSAGAQTSIIARLSRALARLVDDPRQVQIQFPNGEERAAQPEGVDAMIDV